MSEKQMRKSQEIKMILKALAGSVCGVVLFIYLDVNFLATLSLFAFLGSAIWLVWALLTAASGSVAHAIDLRGNIVEISPIQTAADFYDALRSDRPRMDVPAIKNEWLSMIEDQKILKEYASRLDACRAEIDNNVEAAINKFNSDRQILVEQQKSVVRRAFKAKRQVKRYRNLPKVNLSTAHLTRVEKLSIPASPKYLTPAQYATKYQLNPQQVGSGLARVLTMNGGINQGNVIATVVAAAALAIAAKAMISRALRALEDARGRVELIWGEAQTTVALLSEAHMELVHASERMRVIAEEIDGLDITVQRLPHTYTLEQLPPDQADSVKNLWFWIMSADQVSRDTIA